MDIIECYSMITKGEVKSQLGLFFKGKQMSDLKRKCKKMQRFIISRNEYVTQADVFLFLQTELPEFLEKLNQENQTRFIDLCCSICIQYQDCALNLRNRPPGLHSDWNQRYYPKYNKNLGNDPRKGELEEDDRFFTSIYPNLDHEFKNYTRIFEKSKKQHYLDERTKS